MKKKKSHKKIQKKKILNKTYKTNNKKKNLSGQ